jgi:hypothetical protein
MKIGVKHGLDTIKANGAEFDISFCAEEYVL